MATRAYNDLDYYIFEVTVFLHVLIYHKDSVSQLVDVYGIRV